MPIRVECDVCGAKYRVDDRRAGTEIPCKSCDADIRVPGGRGGRRPARAVSHRRDDFDEDEFEESPGNPAVFVISLVAGALVLAGIAFGVMFALKDDDPALNQVAQNDPEADPAVSGEAPEPDPVNPPPAFDPKPVDPRPDVFNKPRPPFNPRPRPEPVQPIVENDPEPVDPPRGFLPPDENMAELPADLDGPWNVQFDSIAEPIAFEEGRKLRVPLPTGVGATEVLWPTAPSYFVALGNNGNEREVREVYDIRNGRKIGRIGGFRAWNGKFALSPDGKFFAVSNRESNGIFVWDVAAGKAKGTLPLASTWGAKVLDFAGPKRLVAAADDSSPLQVWSLPDGNPERTIEMPEDYVGGSVGFSHGGRYVAVYCKTRGGPNIQIFDLDTGERAGALRVPQSNPDEFWVPDCHALMFSPDGAELAGLFEEFGRKFYFYSFDLKDRDVNLRVEIEASWNFWPHRLSATPIQWFPDRNRWLLFGSYLLDRNVGKIVWKFPNERELAPGRRVLTDELMMAVSGDKDKPNLASFAVEEAKLAKAADAVESGGTLIDAGLPPLTAINRSAAKELALDVAAGDWQAGPDPAPAGEAPLRESVSVTATGGKMTGLLLSNPEAGRAAVFSELRGRGRPRRGRASNDSGAFAQVDFYNLRSGRRTDQLNFGFPTKMAALSPSGKRIASLLQPDQTRIDIWSSDEDKPILALRPYSEEPNKAHHRIEAVAFVDDEHLLTLNNQKKLVLWKIPECKAVYEISEATQPGLSPNQKYLAVSTGRGYVLLDSRTGNQVGGFNIEGTMHAAAFHPDGKRFAGSCTGPRGPSLVVWSMEDGGVLSEFPIQHSAQSMHWCEGDYLLVNNQSLVDVEHKLIVWRYRLGTGAHSPQSPDGRHWYITPRGASGAELVASSLPEPTVAEHLAMQTLKPEFLLEPGGRLSVQLNVPESGPGQSNIRKRALENLITKYQNYGTSVGGGSELVLKMEMKNANTGKTQQVELSESRMPFGVFNRGSGEAITLPLLKIDCKVTFTYQGEVIHEKITSYSNQVFSERIPDGKSPEQHMSEKMWSMATGYVTGYNPPVYVFRDFEGKGFGMSTLSDQGPLPQGIEN